jgi:hypothetical protein
MKMPSPLNGKRFNFFDLPVDGLQEFLILFRLAIQGESGQN